MVNESSELRKERINELSFELSEMKISCDVAETRHPELVEIFTVGSANSEINPMQGMTQTPPLPPTQRKSKSRYRRQPSQGEHRPSSNSVKCFETPENLPSFRSQIITDIKTVKAARQQPRLLERSKLYHRRHQAEAVGASHGG